MLPLRNQWWENKQDKIQYSIPGDSNLHEPEILCYLSAPCDLYSLWVWIYQQKQGSRALIAQYSILLFTKRKMPDTRRNRLKVVLGGSPRFPDNNDRSKCHHLYDLGRHIEQPYQFNSLKSDSKDFIVTTPWDHLKAYYDLRRGTTISAIPPPYPAPLVNSDDTINFHNVQSARISVACNGCEQRFGGSKMWQSPIGKQAVLHWASMLRWIWSISECLSGKVEGADLKNNSQSTTHIDPKVGNWRHLLTVCLTKVHTIDWNPNGVPMRSHGFY